jgi:hypothetical protein
MSRGENYKKIEKAKALLRRHGFVLTRLSPGAQFYRGAYEEFKDEPVPEERWYSINEKHWQLFQSMLEKIEKLEGEIKKLKDDAGDDEGS